MRKYETGPVRSMADVDAELALLQLWDNLKNTHSIMIFFCFRRFDSLERIIDDKMKMLFDFANNLSVTNLVRSPTYPIATTDASDNRTAFHIDKFIFSK